MDINSYGYTQLSNINSFERDAAPSKAPEGEVLEDLKRKISDILNSPNSSIEDKINLVLGELEKSYDSLAQQLGGGSISSEDWGSKLDELKKVIDSLVSENSSYSPNSATTLKEYSSLIESMIKEHKSKEEDIAKPKPFGF